MDRKDVWSSADIIENKNNWTLASDAELLKLLKTLSEKIFDKSRSTLSLLISLENEVNRTCTSVANVNNRFRALYDTQFIESKVQDDTSEIEGASTFETKTEETPSKDDFTAKLKHALDNGIQVLRTQYDILTVTDSDTDDDETQQFLLKSRNPYMRRRLPYIIGSEEFTKYDHVGLVSSSEDDIESESEVEVDNIPRSKTKVISPQPVEVSFSKQRTEVICISSDSEDSEDSLARKKINFTEIPKTQPAYPTNSFVSHLNETLKNDNIISVPVPSIVDEIFSPPPFPTQYINDLSEAEDENSDNSSGDIFSSKKFSSNKRVQFQTSNAIEKKFNNDESAQSTPSSFQYNNSFDSAIANPDSHPQKLVNTLDNHVSQLPSKSNANMSGNKLFNDMHAELNAKLQRKNYSRNEDKSTSEDSNSDGNSKKINGISSSPGSKHRASPSLSSYVSQITPKLMHAEAKLDNLQSKTKSSDIVKPKLSNKIVIPNLFCDDDDDSMDELFNSKETSEGTPGFEEPSRKFVDQIFFDDIKSEDIIEIRKKEKQSVEIPQYMNSVPTLLNKKLDLFNDDSESDDDIFSIINSPKKKTPVADVSNTLLGSSKNKKETSSKSNSKSNKFVSDEKKPMSKPNPELENHLFGSHSEDNAWEPEKKHLLFDKNSKYDMFNFGHEKVSESYGKENISNPLSIAAPRTNIQDAKEENLFPTNTNSKEVTSFKKSVPLAKYDLFSSDNYEIISQHCLENLEVDFSSQVINKSNALKPENSDKGGSKKVDLEISFDCVDQNLLKKLDSPTVNSKSSRALSKATSLKPQILETPDKDVDMQKFYKSNLVDLVNESSSLESNDQTTVANNKLFITSLESIDGSSSRKNLLTGTDSTLRLPGKLSSDRKLNIDVNALLPNLKWSVYKQTKNTSLGADTPELDQIERKSNPSTESDSLNNIIKKRTKVSTTRRPPSRRIRVQRAANSDIFAVTSNTSDEGLASEPNSTDDKSKNLGPVKSGNEGSELKAVEDVIEKNERDYNLPRDQCFGNEDIFNSLSNPTDELTLVDNSRNIAKVEKMKPNGSLLSLNKNEDVSKKFDGFDILSPMKNETADHLNFFSASASREPPAVKESDFKNLFSDLDDEDIFSDVFQRNKINDDDDLDRNFETPREHSDSSHSFISFSNDLNDSNILCPLDVSVLDRRGSSNPSNLFSFTSDDQSNTENISTLSKSPIEARNAGLTKSFQSASSESFKTSSDFPGTSNVGYGEESSQTLNAKMKDDEDDLFSQEPPNPKPVQQSENSAKSSMGKLSVGVLHAPGDHSVALGSQETVPVKASGSSMDIFGGDDELFATTKMPFIKDKRALKSLFDDDEENDDLFRSKDVSRAGKSVDLSKKISLRSSSEKGRAVKLRSEVVSKDPLAGKDSKE